MYPIQGLGGGGATASQPPINPRRPSTSRPESARPGTSFGQGHPQGQQYHTEYDAHYAADQPVYNQQAGGQYGIVEEEYEESDDEDVFAFLPPSTADAAKEEVPIAPVGGFLSNLTPATGPQMYHYPTVPAHANNPFAYAVPSGPHPHQPPLTADTQDPPPSTMTSSVDGAAFAYEPPTNSPYHFYHAYPVGPPPVSPPSSDMDSQPSTGYGRTQGADAFRLEKMKSSTEQAVPSGLGTQAMRMTGVINEEGEGESEPTTISVSEGMKDGEEEVSIPDTKVLSKEMDLGVDMDVRKEYGQDERGQEEMVSARKISRGRKKSRNEKRSPRNSGAGLSSGNGQREADAPSTEGDPTSLRKRKNVNAGPYLNYPHSSEKPPGGRSGRGMILTSGLIGSFTHLDQFRNSRYSDLTHDNFAYLPDKWNDSYQQRQRALRLSACAS